MCLLFHILATILIFCQNSELRPLVSRALQAQRPPPPALHGCSQIYLHACIGKIAASKQMSGSGSVSLAKTN